MNSFLRAPILTSRGELHPMREEIFHTDDGTVWMPHPFKPGARREMPLCNGIGVAWAPVTEANRLILYIIGGNPAAPTEEALAIAMPRHAIGTFIRDLQSIDRQMDPK